MARRRDVREQRIGSGEVTIKLVARRAEVPTATVSYVLNDKSRERISEEVKERVRPVAESLS